MPSLLYEDSFKNLEKQPLNDLLITVTLDNGVKSIISGLNKFWIKRTSFTGYLSIVKSSGCIKTGAELEEWKAVALKYQENIKYLLQRRHHEFWSYMVHSEYALAAVCSFLQNATPFYLDFGKLDKDQEAALELYEAILQIIVQVVVRLVTDRESEECWISKKFLGNLLYSDHLMTIPMLIDLINAVGNETSENNAALQHICTKLIYLEPRYKHDLRQALLFFKNAFQNIHNQAENEGVDGAVGGVSADDTETPYDDVSLFTMDCAYTLSVLLDVCDDACAIAEEEKLGESIAAFYSNTIPILYKYISIIRGDAQSLGWLNRARLQFLKSFRSITLYFIESATDDVDNQGTYAEKFINLLTECLSEQIFVVDYENMYSVKDYIETLSLICENVENDERFKYIKRGYAEQAKSMTSSTIGKIASNTAVKLPAPKTGVADELDLKPSTSKAARMNGSSANTARNGEGKESTLPVNKTPTRDIDLEVSAVLDVFPEHGVGFIRQLLERYDSKEDAISALLEDNLPPDLAKADKTLPYIPPDPRDKLFKETGIEHFNVHDGDAYDILTQDNPNCIIKRGKGFPNAPKNANEMLDDKTAVREIKHKYQQYSMVTDDEYDDEYDDSYDALLESESRAVISKQLKAGLANVEDVSEDESTDDEQEVPQETGNKDKSKMNFCENPEVVRARYEANRQAKYSKRGGGGGGGQNKQRDVVGAPKGKGQDKETVQNRKFKEAHKSTRANHNRKSGAAYKRNF